MKIGVLKILFQVKLKRRFAFKNKNLNFNIFLKSSIPQNLGQCTKKKNISKHVVTIKFFLKLTLYTHQDNSLNATKETESKHVSLKMLSVANC